MTLSYAVMGRAVQHSFSPQIHSWFAAQTGFQINYTAISVAEDRFEHSVTAFFRNGGAGLNITNPYKMRAYAMHDWASERCHLAQSANTLWWENGKLHADNTDGVGLISDLQRYHAISEQHILLLGAGGAAQGILGALCGLNPKSLTVANRTPKITANQNLAVHNYHELKDHYNVIIHATSANMQEQQNIVPMHIFKQLPFCYDLDYHSPTPFTLLSTQAGCRAINGLGMLIEQAAASFFLWHGIQPQTNDMHRVYSAFF